MKLGAIDYVSVALGLGLAILCHYADVEAGIFVGGAWVGAFLFKVGYLAEKRWGKS